MTTSHRHPGPHFFTSTTASKEWSSPGKVFLTNIAWRQYISDTLRRVTWTVNNGDDLRVIVRGA